VDIGGVWLVVAAAHLVRCLLVVVVHETSYLARQHEPDVVAGCGVKWVKEGVEALGRGWRLGGGIECGTARVVRVVVVGRVREFGEQVDVGANLLEVVSCFARHNTSALVLRANPFIQ
jgi:hypothetical protein